MRPLLAGATLLLALLAGAAAGEEGGEGPPDRAPPDATFGGGRVTLDSSGLSLPPGFGVPTAAGAVAVRVGARPVPPAATAPTRARIATVPLDAATGPPDRPPPDASFATSASVALPTSSLGLPPGFGVPTVGAGRVATGVGSIGGLPSGQNPTPRVATIVDAASDDPGPPAALPAGARLGTGTSVSFPTGNVGFATADVGFGTSSISGGVSTADLGGFAVQEEAGGYRFTLGADVLFDFDKSTLRPEAGPILERLVAQVREQLPRARYRVEGHTDAKGSDAYNDRLSDRRARSVRDWLARQGGVQSRLIGTVGYGERSPVAPNEHPDGGDDPEGRQRNRRVEILVTPTG